MPTKQKRTPQLPPPRINPPGTYPSDLPEPSGPLAPRGDDEEVGVIKADVIGARSSSSLLERLVQADEKLPGKGISPPYSFGWLYDIFEFSSLLRPNVDAYVTNIDSFGHHFRPAVDLSSKDATQRIRDAMYYERMLEVKQGKVSVIDTKEPTDDEVAKRREQIRQIARMEYLRVKSFFGFACTDISFTELRRRTRQDLEVTGNAWWEIIRDGLGEVVRVHYLEPIPMRLCEEDESATDVETRYKTTDLSWSTMDEPKYFRRIIRLKDKKEGRERDVRYFKEFGDPRLISRKTGVAYKNERELRQAEGKDAKPATEVLHFEIFTPSSVYGVPRWIACGPCVLGSRELDEVNYNYFQNNVVPPLALLVSGGRFGKGVASKIEEFIDEHLKGRKGQHRILVLEAEGQKTVGEPGPKAIPRVQFVPLRDVQQTDALFQNYDVRNEEKVAKSFRLPRILRGDDTKINKATAFAALKFADEQVFEPLREQFDDVINRRLLPDLGITFWLFRSNAPVIRDPEKMVEMVERLVKVGVLLPNEGREMAEDIFNRTFIEVSEDWSNRPLPITLAQLSHQPADTTAFSQEADEEQDEERPRADDTPPSVVRAGTPLRALGQATEED